MLTLTTDVFASPALLFIKTSGTFGSFLLSTVQNVLRKQKTLYQLKFLQVKGLMWTFTISTGCHSAICESSLTSKNFAGSCGLQAKNNTITFINFMLPLFSMYTGSKVLFSIIPHQTQSSSDIRVFVIFKMIYADQLNRLVPNYKFCYSAPLNCDKK